MIAIKLISTLWQLVIISLNWGYWKNGGLKMEKAFLNEYMNQGFVQISNDAGCEMFERFVNSEYRDISIS